MSHDAWLTVNTGTVEVQVAEIGNYTRNVSPMWRKAMTAATGRLMAIQDTDGWLAEDAAPVFTRAAEHMAENPNEYLPLNPPNGWGNYSGALDYMRTCAEVCRQHPNATVRWSV